MGFYYRHKRDATKALEHFDKVLQMSPDNSRAKREKVNVLLSVGKYVEALDLAKENYEQNKSNIFHIHSYFISIIRRHGLNESEKIILKGLMDEVKQNEAPKADDILRCMKGEYAFYVELNTLLAINTLRDAMAMNVNSIYPIKSLIEVYRRSGQAVAAEELQRKLQNIDYQN
jgi:tetratricopeptide (TPR) repeat protein